MSFNFDELQWVEAKDNPFEMRCLDVRNYCWNAQSFTRDPFVARRFAELRQSTGEQLLEQSPDNFAKFACHLKYGSQRRIFDETARGPILMAKVMEDKWDIFLYDNFLYFTRSWGGELIYKVQVNISADILLIEAIEVETRLVKEGVEEVLCDVDFLVKSHLHNLPVPHHIDNSIPEADKQLITIDSFTSFGRWASFATYEDTTRLQI